MRPTDLAPDSAANRRRLRWRVGALLLTALAISACRTTNAVTDQEIQALVGEYEKQTAQLKLRREAERQRGILALETANPEAPLGERRVTAHLDNAYLDVVLGRLGINYTLLDGASLQRRVTASFEDLPLLEALEAVLAPVGLQATLDQHVLLISRRPGVELDLSSANDYVFYKKRLSNVDTRVLEAYLDMLLGITDSDDDGDSEEDSSSTKSLSAAPLHAENAILLQGPSAAVRNAVQLLDSIDSGGRHILIEALVIEFGAEYLLDIGSRLSDGAKGNYSGVSIDWANLVGQTIAFTSLAGAANTTMFTAAINLLLRDNHARVIARPYLATMSGTQATMEVVEDRYVTTFSATSDDITLEPVTSGVSLTITPFELPDEQIRMDVQVTLSRFVPNLDNVNLARTRSDATSTVRVGAGETLVIGGLMAEQSSDSTAGVPGARKIPGLGLLFGQHQKSTVRKHLLIYITPYLWDPGLETPIVPDVAHLGFPLDEGRPHEDN
jgi:Bacterial type II and III secretion system protein